MLRQHAARAYQAYEAHFSKWQEIKIVLPKTSRLVVVLLLFQGLPQVARVGPAYVLEAAAGMRGMTGSTAAAPSAYYFTHVEAAVM